MSNVASIMLNDFTGCEFTIKIAESKNGPYVDGIIFKNIVEFNVFYFKCTRKNISPRARKKKSICIACLASTFESNASKGKST